MAVYCKGTHGGVVLCGGNFLIVIPIQVRQLLYSVLDCGNIKHTYFTFIFEQLIIQIQIWLKYAKMEKAIGKSKWLFICFINIVLSTSRTCLENLVYNYPWYNSTLECFAYVSKHNFIWLGGLRSLVARFQFMYRRVSCCSHIGLLCGLYFKYILLRF